MAGRELKAPPTTGIKGPRHAVCTHVHNKMPGAVAVVQRIWHFSYSVGSLHHRTDDTNALRPTKVVKGGPPDMKRFDGHAMAIAADHTGPA